MRTTIMSRYYLSNVYYIYKALFSMKIEQSDIGSDGKVRLVQYHRCGEQFQFFKKSVSRSLDSIL